MSLPPTISRVPAYYQKLANAGLVPSVVPKGRKAILNAIAQAAPKAAALGLTTELEAVSDYYTQGDTQNSLSNGMKGANRARGEHTTLASGRPFAQREMQAWRPSQAQRDAKSLEQFVGSWVLVRLVQYGGESQMLGRLRTVNNGRGLEIQHYREFHPQTNPDQILFGLGGPIKTDASQPGDGFVEVVQAGTGRSLFKADNLQSKAYAMDPTKVDTRKLEHAFQADQRRREAEWEK